LAGEPSSLLPHPTASAAAAMAMTAVLGVIGRPPVVRLPTPRDYMRIPAPRLLGQNGRPSPEMAPRPPTAGGCSMTKFPISATLLALLVASVGAGCNSDTPSSNGGTGGTTPKMIASSSGSALTVYHDPYMGTNMAGMP